MLCHHHGIFTHTVPQAESNIVQFAWLNTLLEDLVYVLHSYLVYENPSNAKTPRTGTVRGGFEFAGFS